MPDYEITSPDGKTFIVTAPEGATQEQVLSYAKQQFEAQHQATQQSTASDVPLVPGMQGYDQQQAAQQKQAAANPEPDILDKIGSGLSALGRTAVAAPLAMAGSIYGGAHGIGRSIAEGSFGTQAGSDMAAQTAAQDVQSFTAPAMAGASPLTQEYMGNIGEKLGALDPAMAGGAQGINLLAKPALTQIGESAIAQGAKKAISNEAALVPKSIADVKATAGGIMADRAKAEGAPILGQSVSENTQTVKRLLDQDPSRDLATKELKVVDPSLKDAQGNLLPEAYKVVDNPAAKEAIKNGIDDGVVGLIKKSDPYTAQKMKAMTDISERNKSDLEYAVDNRPSQVVGDEILSDYKHVESINKAAGKAIDNEAKNTLRGKAVDISEPIDQFISTLKDELGVELKQGADGKMVPVFTKSQIRLSSDKTSRQFIKNIIDDLSNAGNPDAYNVHTFKRAIDNRVVYGDSSSALNGTVESAVKKLRNGLDGVLDSNFEGYNKANQDYTKTITALGNLREVAGKKLKFNEAGANEQLGVLSRGMLSNIKSRQQLTNAITGLQDTANEYGANSKANIKNLVMYANELDRRFGSHAPTSFAGETQKATASSGAEILGKAAMSGATGSHHGMISTAVAAKDKLFGTTNKDAYSALKKLTIKQYGKKEAAQ